jgi:glutathione peroxidase
MDRLLELGLESYAQGLISSHRFWDRPVVVFNTASFCGFTKQIASFQKLFLQGSIVPIALPTNEFGQQEPGDDYEIRQFLKTKYQVTFPVCMKTDLQHVIFQRHGEPTWNFNKYLFDKKHNFVDKFDSNFKPEDLISHV